MNFPQFAFLWLSILEIKATSMEIKMMKFDILNMYHILKKQRDKRNKKPVQKNFKFCSKNEKGNSPVVQNYFANIT